MTAYFFSNFTAEIGKPTSSTLTPVTNTVLLRSALSYGTQTIARPGGYWQLDLTWQNIYGEAYRALTGMLALLNGGEHTMDFAPNDIGYGANGPFSGSPVVDGGSQTGNTLAIRGASVSITDWAVRGDLFRITGSPSFMHMTTEPADSDGSGDVSLSIWPELRGSPADGSTIIVNQAGRFRLIAAPQFQTSARSKTAGNELIATVTASFVDTAQP